MKSKTMQAVCWVVLALCFPFGSAFALTLTQTKLGNIFLTGEPPQFILQGTGSVDWSIKNYFGQTVAGGTLALSGTASLQPGITLPGYYELKLQEKNEQKTVAHTFDTTFAIVAPLPLSSASPFGAQTHFAQYNATDLLEVIARGNISHIRDEQYWNDVEKNRNTFLYPEKFTAYVHAAASRGITPLITADWANPLYDYEAGQFTAPHTESGREGYANYAKSILSQYENQIPALEIWNEYNAGTFCNGPAASNKPLFYTQMLRRTYEIAKPQFPNIKILAGGTVPISHGFFQALFQNGALAYLDVLSVHPYRSVPQGIELDISELRELTKKANQGKALPIWATEFSKNVTSASGRLQAAQYLVQIATMMRSAGVERMYYYLSQDDSNFPYRGLVRGPDDPAGKYVPNPVYSAYANLIGQISLWTPKNRVIANLKSTTFAYKFTNGKQVRHVLWALSPTTVKLATDASLVQTDIMGATGPLVPVNGEIALALTEDPVFVTGEITGFSELNNLVLADSLCDYDKVQGSKSWTYGYANVPPGTTYQIDNFQSMTWEIWGNDVYRWRKPNADYPYIGLDMMHPGFGSDWAVRRWKSSIAGKIRLVGSGSVAANSRDGVGVRVYRDGKEILARTLLPGGTLDFSLGDIAVQPGTQLDCAVSSQADTGNDATSLQLRIFQEPVAPTFNPTPTATPFSTQTP